MLNNYNTYIIYMIPYIPIIDDIGFFGPIILSILTVIILWGRMKYLQLYLVFMLFNLFSNKVLKKLIQSPRPVNHDKNMIYTTFEKTNGTETYGMPSGHAQSVSFSTLYMYLVTKSDNLLIGSSFISCLTLLQRYRFKRHSIRQLFIGSAIGCLVAYISYNLSTIIIHSAY